MIASHASTLMISTQNTTIDWKYFSGVRLMLRFTGHHYNHAGYDVLLSRLVIMRIRIIVNAIPCIQGTDSIELMKERL